MSDNIDILMEDMIKVRKTYGGDTLSVEEVLSIPTLNRYIILGGEKGLKNRCKHITILETPTGISWLEGEEFLLTAGYAFYSDEERKKSMLHDAKTKGVSAIAIKENRYFGEVNKELIDQANEYNIPLILIPYEVVYTNTVSSFYDMLFFRKNEYILRLNIIYEKLMDIRDISKVGLYGLAYKENVDDTRESPTLQLLKRMDEHLAFGVKVFDPFLKRRIVDHQFLNFEDFVNEIEIIIIMVGHDHIKESMDLIKDKLILDTKNICDFNGVYKI